MFSIFIIRFIVWDSIGDPGNKNYLLRNKFSKCVGTKSTYFEQKKLKKRCDGTPTIFNIEKLIKRTLKKNMCKSQIQGFEF